MKCGGKGLEIEFDLSPNEVSELIMNGSLSGIAHMWDYDENKYSVPVELSTRIEDRMADHFNTEMVLVETIPNDCYFLDSERISFYLGETMQRQLRENGCTGSRFGTGGKVKISATAIRTGYF